jgi:hypothetical protein
MSVADVFLDSRLSRDAFMIREKPCRSSKPGERRPIPLSQTGPDFTDPALCKAPEFAPMPAVNSGFARCRNRAICSSSTPPDPSGRASDAEGPGGRIPRYRRTRGFGRPCNWPATGPGLAAFMTRSKSSQGLRLVKGRKNQPTQLPQRIGGVYFLWWRGL